MDAWGNWRLNALMWEGENMAERINPLTPHYVICRCQHCDGNIEFDASQFEKGETRTVKCPHCHSVTVISIPPSTISMWTWNGLLPTFGLNSETTPRYRQDFVGQDRIKRKIQLAIEASKQNSQPLGHIILAGPTGSWQAPPF